MLSKLKVSCIKLHNCFLADINECSSNPCLNGATCVDAVDGYECDCRSGYEGTHCQIG